MENFDWKTFFITAAAGSPFFLYFITAGVEWLKNWKNAAGEQIVTGQALELAALLFGTVFGALFMVVTNRPPQTTDWWEALSYAFMVIVYGLLQGFMAAKNYEAHKNATEKMVARYNGLVR
jgi:hypothetical protein